MAHSSLFTIDGQGLQRVSAGAPPVLQWCSNGVVEPPAARDNLCQIVPFCATNAAYIFAEALIAYAVDGDVDPNEEEHIEQLSRRLDELGWSPG